MKISDLSPNLKNPRNVTPEKLSMLRKAIAEFGDLSGIVYNRRTKHLVGGHQRRKIFAPDTTIVYTKKLAKPTKSGTVAEGYFVHKGERFSYREVDWDVTREKAANIAANKNAGEWDLPQLGEWMKDLGSFDVDFDIELTMFDENELKQFDGVTVKEHVRKPGGEKEKEAPAPAKCKAGEVYMLGETKLVCGASELHYCDLILARWEKHSGEKAKLQPKTFTRKPLSQDSRKAAKQPNSRHG